MALAIGLCGSAASFGQELKPFFPPGECAVLEYEDRDADGNIVAFSTDSTMTFSGDFTQGSLKICSIVSYPGDTLKLRSTIPVLLDKGEVIVDLAATMEDMLKETLAQSLAAAGTEGLSEEDLGKVMDQTTVTGECRGIPCDVSVGMKLPDYGVTLKIVFLTMKIDVADRKVAGREMLTTPAGTFDCFVVEETMTYKLSVMSQKTRLKSWYARGIGMVRQETWEKNKLSGTSVLTACRNVE